LETSQTMTGQFPLLGILSHYYLGQLYERTGKRDQAMKNTKCFSHTSRLRNPGSSRSAMLAAHSSD
jgi:hypothetical protein